jgi:hypothetical protein
VTSIYLLLNAAVYLVFAVWCTILPARTAAGVGYVELTRGGSSEYLVVYGGLQLGLALFFAWCARRGLDRTGLIFALALYAPIVAYRLATVSRNWPVGSTTLVVATLEALLLGSAIALWFAAAPADA